MTTGHLNLRLAGVAVLLTVATTSLAGQGSIRGTLADSLRGGSALAGATVTLVEQNQTATTDARGRFSFVRLEPGRYTVRFAGPRLDSLGVAPIAQSVVVEGRRAAEVALAIPPAAWFQRQYCGTELPGAGVVIGVVRNAAGAPQAGVPTTAIWDAASLRDGDVVVETMATLDTTDAEGRFALCGVPLRGQASVRAVRGSERSGDLVVATEGQAVLRRDLRIGEAGETARVSGRIVTRRRPLVGAEVELWGDTTRNTRTDDQGRFVLTGVPRRTAQLYVRAIGQTPRMVTVEPTGAELDIGEVVLEEAVVALLPMTIRERALTRERLEFAERRNGAVGVFFDSTELAVFPRVTAAAIASKSTAVRVGVSRSFLDTTGDVIMLRGVSMADINSGCYPRVFLNGVFISTQRPIPTMGAAEERAISPQYMRELLRLAKRIEIYNAREAPQQFHDPDGCGALVIWTR